MGQVLHGSATTTEAVRRAIQNSQASLRALAGRYGINPKTVAKWRGRTSVCDAPMGPKKPRSTVFKQGGRGVNRRLSQTYVAAARRLPLCPSGHRSASHAIILASLLTTPWHQPPA